MDLNSVVSWLTGSPQAQTQVNLAPKPTTYPSNDDADFARKYGFGYGTGNEPFLNNEKARVMGNYIPLRDVPEEMPKTHTPLPHPRPAAPSQLFMPNSAEGMNTGQAAAMGMDAKHNPLVDLNKAGNGIQDDMNNRYMRAALAANRIPISSIGLDPNNTAMDLMIHDPGILGLTDHNGSMYSAVDQQSNNDALLHEATHNGMRKIRETYPQEYKAATTWTPDEESTVRYLMATQGGDLEKGMGSTADKQREDALRYFKNVGPDAEKGLNSLQELAIRYKKEQNPRGPH